MSLAINSSPVGMNGFLSIAPTSQYLEDNSLFSSAAGLGCCYPGSIFGGCCNASSMVASNNAFYNLMGVNSDNMTSLEFKNRGNQFTLNSTNEVVQRGLISLASSIRSGQLGQASATFDSLFQTLGQSYGLEMMTHDDRVNAEKAIKAHIVKNYELVNGAPLVSDVSNNGSGYFSTGFMQGLTLGHHHKNSAEETISYMTGRGIENYHGKKAKKIAGKILGGTISTAITSGVGVALGAGVAAVAGVAAAPVMVVGGAIAGVFALGSILFGGNKTTKITEA